MNTKEVVLTGHNFNSLLGLARAFGRIGYKVHVIRTGTFAKKSFVKRIGNTPEARCKYINTYVMIESNRPELLVDLLKNRFQGKGRRLLIPVDDMTAKAIDLHYDELNSLYMMPNIDNTQGGVVRLMDKAYQKELAVRAGLLVAKGYSMKVQDGSYEIPEDIQFPCFVKADIPFQSRKKFMGKCRTYEDLKEHLKNVASYGDCTMLIEEYLPIEHEYCVVGLCNRDKVCIPDVIDEKVMGHGVHAGVTCFGKVLPSDQFPELTVQLKQYMSNLNFQGLFTIDILSSGGKLYFCELNLRIGGSGISVISAGVNLAKMYADLYEGKDIKNYDVVCREMTFASERPLLNDYEIKKMTWKEYCNYIRKADYRFVYDKEDKKPYYNYGFLVLKSFAKRMLKH